MNRAIRDISCAFSASRLAAAIGSVLLVTASLAAQARPPVIIIPGLTGSELVNDKTGEKVWFKARRSKVDDLRLPISPNLAADRDSLVPGDILRTVNLGLKKLDAYGGLIDALEKRGGYTEGNWEHPTSRGYENTIYVFPYDWRLDNVGNARLLVRRVEELKRKLRRPNLKFDIVSHSMGGIIARYAAMYGNFDLPAGKSKLVPTWAGARYFNRIVILGTPNEGSARSLVNLLDGFAVGGVRINLPFVQNLSKFDVFTIPSGFQLLPAPGTFRAFDENLKPMNLDLYNPKVWSDYGWNVIDDKDFAKHFGAADRRNAQSYFAVVLNRARRLHEALDEKTTGQIPVSINVIGSECKDTLDSVVIYQSKKGDKWKILSKAEAFTRSDGTKVSDDEVKKAIFAPGDGVVTKRSLTASTLSGADGVESILFPVLTTFVCEGHDSLPGNQEIQDKIIGILSQK